LAPLRDLLAIPTRRSSDLAESCAPIPAMALPGADDHRADRLDLYLHLGKLAVDRPVPGLDPGGRHRVSHLRQGRAHLADRQPARSEEHTSELQSPCNIVCR